MDLDGDLLDELSATDRLQQRPVFLTVLCVLTFVGSGLYIIYSFYTFSWISGLGEGMTGDLMETEFGNYLRWYKLERYVAIIGAIGCSIGAYFMLKMKRFGFYIYVVSQILPLALGVVTMNSLGGAGGFQFITLILSAIFPVGFIILYSLNYKYLK